MIFLTQENSSGSFPEVHFHHQAFFFFNGCIIRLYICTAAEKHQSCLSAAPLPYANV